MGRQSKIAHQVDLTACNTYMRVYNLARQFEYDEGHSNPCVGKLNIQAALSGAEERPR
jgi:hypothetical protein